MYFKFKLETLINTLLIQCAHESGDNFYFKYIFECLGVHYF
jgi:hypothetical protein